MENETLEFCESEYLEELNRELETLKTKIDALDLTIKPLEKQRGSLRSQSYDITEIVDKINVKRVCLGKKKVYV